MSRAGRMCRRWICLGGCSIVDDRGSYRPLKRDSRSGIWCNSLAIDGCVGFKFKIVDVVAEDDRSLGKRRGDKGFPSIIRYTKYIIDRYQITGMHILYHSRVNLLIVKGARVYHIWVSPQFTILLCTS